MPRLSQTCPPHLRPIIVTALNTGIRKGEIPSLEWRRLTWPEKLFILKRQKEKVSTRFP